MVFRAGAWRALQQVRAVGPRLSLTASSLRDRLRRIVELDQTKFDQKTHAHDRAAISRQKNTRRLGTGRKADLEEYASSEHRAEQNEERENGGKARMPCCRTTSPSMVSPNETIAMIDMARRCRYGSAVMPDDVSSVIANATVLASPARCRYVASARRLDRSGSSPRFRHALDRAWWSATRSLACAVFRPEASSASSDRKLNVMRFIEAMSVQKSDIWA